MKFLIKIEEAIDGMILAFIEKMKAATPHFVYSGIDWLKHSPHLIKEKITIVLNFFKFIFSTVSAFLGHYTTMIKGHIVGIQIYLRSDEFKNRDKTELLIYPLKKLKTDPKKSFIVLGIVIFFSVASYKILTSAQKIIIGTNALRHPASAFEEEPIIEFKKLEYKSGPLEFKLDITLEAKSIEEKDKIEKQFKKVEEELLSIPIHVDQLPLNEENLKHIKNDILEKFSLAELKSIEIKMSLAERPKYFMQAEKMFKIKDIDLQLFLEDTKRNRQAYVDFTVLAENRNIVLFLQDHEVQLRDHINTNVEPVIPQLPIEDEGRQIIRDKIRTEINDFLKKHDIEGVIKDVFIDYLMVS